VPAAEYLSWPSAIRAVPDRISEVHGMKSVGTELSGLRAGTFHDDYRTTFAVCHAHSPGIVIDPEEIAARLATPS
jgi:hypothetical protein